MVRVMPSRAKSRLSMTARRDCAFRLAASTDRTDPIDAVMIKVKTETATISSISEKPAESFLIQLLYYYLITISPVLSTSTRMVLPIGDVRTTVPARDGPETMNPESSAKSMVASGLGRRNVTSSWLADEGGQLPDSSHIAEMTTPFRSMDFSTHSVF